jgi:formylglycine-generating enzyme required for sulfatase activity
VQLGLDVDRRAGANEALPITCVNWFEAMAFCAWDAGHGGDRTVALTLVKPETPRA